MDDDDWGFDEDNCECRTYEDARNDLSEEVNNGHRIRDLRLLAEITPEKLASSLTMNAQDLLALEAGMLQLDHNAAQEIAQALHIKVSDIWSGN